MITLSFNELAGLIAIGIVEARAQLAWQSAQTNRDRLLTELAEAHRKHPNGTMLDYEGRILVVIGAIATYDNKTGTVHLAYGLARNGEPFHTLAAEVADRLPVCGTTNEYPRM